MDGTVINIKLINLFINFSLNVHYIKQNVEYTQLSIKILNALNLADKRARIEDILIIFKNFTFNLEVFEDLMYNSFLFLLQTVLSFLDPLF